MTAILLALLIWILFGGFVYLMVINNLDIGYTIWREQNRPPSELTGLLKNKKILMICLVLGPVTLLLALYALICEQLKGKTK